jgi:hypothetical protein
MIATMMRWDMVDLNGTTVTRTTTATTIVGWVHHHFQPPPPLYNNNCMNWNNKLTVGNNSFKNSYNNKHYGVPPNRQGYVWSSSDIGLDKFFMSRGGRQLDGRPLVVVVVCFVAIYSLLFGPWSL